MKKTAGYVDYFIDLFNQYDIDDLGKISTLNSKAVKLLIDNEPERLQMILDELALSFVESVAFDEAKFQPLSAHDEALIKSFKECTDYLTENPEAQDAKPIATLIDSMYFKTKKTVESSFSDDILPLHPDREYKIKAELFKMPLTPEIDGFYEIFLKKMITFFSDNQEFVSSENEREILNGFIENAKNNNFSDPEKLLFDTFPYGEYDFIFESLSASSLDEYDKYGACLVGGFPHFAQGDYRPEGYSELLLQIDSFDYKNGYENTVMWGDGGVINFFIKPEDLKNADFSDIYIGGDCS
jgi:uncharacterized protein YwqG